MRPTVLTLILAGGRGTRLEPLTRDRAKPAVPFAGPYRIIDFTLSNTINSGLRQVYVLTQFKSRSLERHIRLGWNYLSAPMGEFIDVLPPQQRIDENWYKGTADAIYQNIYTLEKDDPEHLLVLAGDHIYKMDYWAMVEQHRAAGADLTIGCIPIPVSECDQFGIMDVDRSSRVVGFTEKPKTTAPLPDDPGRCLGSMGIYVFNTRTLFELLCEDAAKADSGHDFGKDVIPHMLLNGYKVFAYKFRDLNNKARPYWRDVGTLDAYYQATLDLVAADPELNLYDASWPIRTWQSQSPPPKFVHAGEGAPGQTRRGEALDSIVSPGCIVSGGSVRRSVLSPNVRVNSYAVVEDSILFDGAEVGRYCRVRRAILDKDVKLPAYTVIGHDLEFDRQRGFTVTDSGVVVVPKSEPAETFQAPNRLP